MRPVWERPRRSSSWAGCRPTIAVPELLEAWGQPLDTQESLAFAWACAMVADSRLVPAVSTLLDPRQWQIRAYAVEALTRIDSEEAASTLWPHLDEEADLSRRLRLIAFLGRHGFKRRLRPDDRAPFAGGPTR